MSCGRPPGRAKRLLRRLAFRRRPPDVCSDFGLEPPPDSFVREPLRPRPQAPGGTVALEIPRDTL